MIKCLVAVCGSAVVFVAPFGMFAVTLAALSAFTSTAQDQPPVRDLSFFLRRLRTIDHLPELEASHTAMSSTWDRSGGNGDGTDFKNVVKPTADRPGRNILLDTTGPGCIHRIFVGVLTEQQAGTRIQIFLDHSPKPLFDMPILEFFADSNGPFPYPLVFHKSYPGTLFPLPFEEHCVVQLVNEQCGHPTVYSFHLNDAFQFQRNVRVAEEQMGYGPGEKVIRERHPLWTGTAFWYATTAQSAGSN